MSPPWWSKPHQRVLGMMIPRRWYHSTTVITAKKPQQHHQQHLIVLVHGWLGNAQELGYLHQQLLQKQPQQPHSTNSSWVVHASTCNTGKTFDGIQAGGQRLADELHTLLSKMTHPQTPPQTTKKTTLSIIGNSLGGLYARQALGRLLWTTNNVDWTPQLFVTLNTPHLGLAGRYWPWRRNVVASSTTTKWEQALMSTSCLRQTGRDLFGNNNNNDDDHKSILYRLATDPQFIKPLVAFDQRLAYGNRQGTDMLVPTSSALFWDDDNDNNNDNNHVWEYQSDDPFPHVAWSTSQNHGVEDYSNDASTMSQRLDALGWTKVLWDLSSSSSSHLLQISNKKNLDTNTQTRTMSSAQTLLKEYCYNNTIHYCWDPPRAHNLLVANSKYPLYERIHRQGRPVMEYLAQWIYQQLENTVKK